MTPLRKRQIRELRDAGYTAQQSGHLCDPPNMSLLDQTHWIDGWKDATQASGICPCCGQAFPEQQQQLPINHAMLRGELP